MTNYEHYRLKYLLFLLDEIEKKDILDKLEVVSYTVGVGTGQQQVLPIVIPRSKLLLS